MRRGTPGLNEADISLDEMRVRRSECPDELIDLAKCKKRRILRYRCRIIGNKSPRTAANRAEAAP